VNGAAHVEIVREARLKGQRPATKKAARAWAIAFHALRQAHDEVTTIGRFIDRFIGRASSRAREMLPPLDGSSAISADQASRAAG
jgi:hypothetical protein